MQGIVSMGDMQSEEERDILVTLDLPQADMPINQPYINITLKYFNVIKKDNDQHVMEVSIDRRTDIGKREPSKEVDEQRNRFKTIASLIKAGKLAEQGRMKEATAVISSQQLFLNDSSSCNSPRVSSLYKDLATASRDISSERVYSSGGLLCIP